MKKISTFLQSKTSAHVILYKIWMNKNGGQSNPTGRGNKRMNTPLGTIQTKELHVRYLERASLRSIQNATQHEPTDPILSDCLGHKFYKTSCNIHTRKNLVNDKKCCSCTKYWDYIFRLQSSILPISNIQIHLCTKERERELQRCCQRLIW